MATKRKTKSTEGTNAANDKKINKKKIDVAEQQEEAILKKEQKPAKPVVYGADIVEENQNEEQAEVGAAPGKKRRARADSKKTETVKLFQLTNFDSSSSSNDNNNNTNNTNESKKTHNKSNEVSETRAKSSSSSRQKRTLRSSSSTTNIGPTTNAKKSKTGLPTATSSDQQQQQPSKAKKTALTKYKSASNVLSSTQNQLNFDADKLSNNFKLISEVSQIKSIMKSRVVVVEDDTTSATICNHSELSNTNGPQNENNNNNNNNKQTKPKKAVKILETIDDKNDQIANFKPDNRTKHAASTSTPSGLRRRPLKLPQDVSMIVPSNTPSSSCSSKP
jgi:hypothetical protein